MRPAEARSTAHRALPAAPAGPSNSLLLFYAYREPAWSEEEHTRALRKVLGLAEQHLVKGRGRCAPEGLNCTLSGAARDVRAFCLSLRRWDEKLFGPCDFKITDGLKKHELFKRLTIRKTEELVGYGLAGTRAPALETSSARHLDADAYHAALEDPTAVVVDVRNQYETEIGRMAPPPGGAEFLDPKIRNSHEFPRWLNAPETRKKLAGRTVLMYCTGGIRCERASALLDAMGDLGAAAGDRGGGAAAGDRGGGAAAGDLGGTAAADLGGTAGAASSCPDGTCPSANAVGAIASAKPKEILMVRGGIERYLRTHPDGGYWTGANYLFDRRFEQRPETAIEKTPLGACGVCEAACEHYRGKFVCGSCKVPALVCRPCREAGDRDDLVKRVRCRLCREGHAGARRVAVPDVVDAPKKPPPKPPRRASRVVFLGNLPFTVERSEVLSALGLDESADVAWLVDGASGLFYGSVHVDAGSCAAALRALARGPLKLRGRKLRVDYGPAAVSSMAPRGPRPPCQRAGVSCFSSKPRAATPRPLRLRNTKTSPR